MINYELANEWLHYNPEKGTIVWRKSPRYGICCGDAAGTLAGNGYLMVKIKGKMCMAHRVMWLLAFRQFPKHEIDHENGIRLDNRLVNLRSATSITNKKNRATSSNNTSGCMGVTWARREQKWQAQIGVDYKIIGIGQFVNWWDAVCARKSAEYKYGFHPNHGRP